MCLAVLQLLQVRHRASGNPQSIQAGFNFPHQKILHWKNFIREEALESVAAKQLEEKLSWLSWWEFLI